jgi:ubiquitin C-terminal hydrolase
MSFSSSMTIPGEGGGGRYQLIAVAVHSGSLGGGHYIAYGCREGTWYLFNDSNCSVTSASQVLEAQAYLLIYMKS